MPATPAIWVLATTSGDSLADNAGARERRRVGVANIDGDSHFPHRGHGLFVQHTGAHVGQFADLRVSHLFHGPRVVDYPWIRHQQARHIRPVFVEHGVGSSRGNRAAHVGTAAGKGTNLTFSVPAVKAGNYIALASFGEALTEQPPGLRIHQAVGADHDALSGLYELGAQPGGEQQTAKMLTPGGRIIRGNAPAQCIPKLLQVRRDHRRDAQVPLNAGKALDNLGKGGGKIGADTGRVLAQVKQVGDLGILASRLPGAEGTMISLRASASTIARTLRNCSGLARLEPPNLQTIRAVRAPPWSSTDPLLDVTA